jgi:hypothetical protein
MLLEKNGDPGFVIDESSPLEDLLNQRHVEPQPVHDASDNVHDSHKTQSQPQLLLGEVIDTHHPDLPRLLFVRWIDGNGEQVERWLQRVRGITPLRGDRVLLEQPANWSEKLVMAVLDDGRSGQPIASAVADSGAPSLQLAAEQCVRIADADDNPLLEIHASNNGPVVRLMNRNATFEVPGKLRFQADTIEFEGGRGGVDIRTEADTVVRSRYIRLN